MNKILLSMLIDECGYITAFCTGSHLQNEMVSLELEELPDNFYDEYQAYRVKDGELQFDETQAIQVRAAAAADNIRMLREIECFSVINRGELWYSKLTEEQLAELSDWYDAWLNAPETGDIPEQPEWLE